MLPELEAREELDDRRVRKSPRPDRPPIENVSAFEVTKVVIASGGEPAHQVCAVGRAFVGTTKAVQAADIDNEVKRFARLWRKRIALFELNLCTGGLASRTRHLQRSVDEVNPGYLPALPRQPDGIHASAAADVERTPRPFSSPRDFDEQLVWSRNSCGRSVVELQEATETLAASHGPVRAHLLARKEEEVVLPLVISLAVEVFDIRAQRGS